MPAPSASAAVVAAFAIVIFLSSISKVATFRYTVSPCTLKLPATYKSFNETSWPVKAIAALAFVKYWFVVSTTLAVVNKGLIALITLAFV